MSSVITAGWNSRAIVSAPAPVLLTRPLKPAMPRRVEQHLGEGEVVLDDQQDAVAAADGVAVVVGDVGEDSPSSSAALLASSACTAMPVNGAAPDQGGRVGSPHGAGRDVGVAAGRAAAGARCAPGCSSAAGRA